MSSYAETPLLCESDPQSTVVDLLEERVQRAPASAMFARFENDAWHDVTAADFTHQARVLATRFIDEGLAPGGAVGILSATRYEWALVEFACWYAGGVVVPLYDSSAPEQIAAILAETRPHLLVIETPEHRERVRRAAGILDADGIAVPLLRDITELHPDTLAALPLDPEAAEEIARRTAARTLDDLATIVYSSGTTGAMKGSRITHGNFVRLVRNIAAAYSDVIREDSRTLLFLPLAHVLARGVQLVAIHAGMTVGHLADPQRLLTQLAPFRPTFLVVVPRLLEKIEAAVAAKADRPVLRALFRAARASAIATAEADAQGTRPGPFARARHRLFDRLFFGRMRALFGGRIETLLSGAGALDADTARFFTGAGLPVVEGYGLTETTAPVTGNLPGHVRFGSVGRPVAGSAVRIADDGEILVRGVGVFAGYEKAALNADAFVDGYFRTGDLGRLDAEGFLTITGRVKDALVTSYGKTVMPEPIERELARRTPLIAHAMLVGDRRPYLGALIILDDAAVAEWATPRGIDPQADAETIPTLRAEIAAAVAAVNATVSAPEQVKRFRMIRADDTELLTPTLKLRRAYVAERFAADIDGLYAP